MQFDSTFIASIREDCGSPQAQELSDGKILDKLQDSINAINDNCPMITLRRFNTVANQQEYPVHVKTKHVREVYRVSPISNINSSAISSIDLGGATFSLLGPTGSDVGLSMFEYPSLFLNWQRKLKHWKEISLTSWDFMSTESGNNVLILMPVPTESDKPVLYESVERYTEEDLPNEFESIIKLKATALCLRVLAAKRNTQTRASRSGRQDGGMDTNALIQQATDLEKQFTNNCRVIYSSYKSVPK